MGVGLMIGSACFAAMEIYYIVSVARMPQFRSSHSSNAELEKGLAEIYNQEHDYLDKATVEDIMEMNFDNEKAVLFGNRWSMIFAYFLTVVACAVTFLLGGLMFVVSGPSLHLSRKFKE